MPLEEIKEELIGEYGNLFSIPTKGYWINEGKCYEDTNEIWTIYTDKEDCHKSIEAYAKRIKEATKQIGQLFVINYRP